MIANAETKALSKSAILPPHKATSINNYKMNFYGFNS